MNGKERIENVLYVKTTIDYLRQNKRKTLCALVSLVLISIASMMAPISLIHPNFLIWQLTPSLELALSLLLRVLGIMGLVAVIYKIGKFLPLRVVVVRLFVLLGLHFALRLVASGPGPLLTSTYGDLSSVIGGLLAVLYNLLISVGFFTLLVVVVCHRGDDLRSLGLISRTQFVWHTLFMITSYIVIAPLVLLYVFADSWLFSDLLLAMFIPLGIVSALIGTLLTVWYAGVSFALFEKMTPSRTDNAADEADERAHPTIISKAEEAAVRYGGITIAADKDEENDLTDLTLGTTIDLEGLRVTVERVQQGPESWSEDSTIEIVVGYANNSDVPKSFGTRDWMLEDKDGTRMNNRPFIDCDDIGDGSLLPGRSKSGSIFITGALADISQVIYVPEGPTSEEEQASWKIAT